jgi:hypothetical protein
VQRLTFQKLFLHALLLLSRLKAVEIPQECKGLILVS